MINRNTMRYAQPCKRSGLSLLEALVVVSILGLLMGLILSGVQRGRLAAARNQCINQVRQLALALHQHHHNHHSLPAGTVPPGDRIPMVYLAWTARILPELEQDALWSQVEECYRLDPPQYPAPPTHDVARRVIPILICPLDTRLTQLRQGQPGLNSYLGVSGTRAKDANGLLFLGSQVCFSQVTDGLSNTLLIGERPPSADLRFGWWHSGWGQRANGSAFDAYLGVTDVNNPDSAGFPEYQCLYGPYAFGPGRTSDQCDTFHFWSLHPNGANFAFADGSVRFLNYSATSVLPALATRSLGETVSFP